MARERGCFSEISVNQGIVKASRRRSLPGPLALPDVGGEHCDGPASKIVALAPEALNQKLALTEESRNMDGRNSR